MIVSRRSSTPRHRRKTGFTLAPEAGTQRLRDLINKNLREEEILATVQSVFRAGWRVLKLYFMIGLPTETLEDLQGLIALVKQIQRAAREVSRSVQINVALSTFVPKPHTPFQWAAQLTPEESRERIGFLQKGLRSKSIQVKWNEPRLSFLEGLLSRGDRRTGHRCPHRPRSPVPGRAAGRRPARGLLLVGGVAPARGAGDGAPGPGR